MNVYIDLQVSYPEVVPAALPLIRVGMPVYDPSYPTEPDVVTYQSTEEFCSSLSANSSHISAYSAFWLLYNGGSLTVARMGNITTTAYQKALDLLIEEGVELLIDGGMTEDGTYSNILAGRLHSCINNLFYGYVQLSPSFPSNNAGPIALDALRVAGWVLTDIPSNICTRLVPKDSVLLPLSVHIARHIMSVAGTEDEFAPLYYTAFEGRGIDYLYSPSERAQLSNNRVAHLIYLGDDLWRIGHIRSQRNDALNEEHTARFAVKVGRIAKAIAMGYLALPNDRVHRERMASDILENIEGLSEIHEVDVDVSNNVDDTNQLRVDLAIRAARTTEKVYLTVIAQNPE